MNKTISVFNKIVLSLILLSLTGCTTPNNHGMSNTSETTPTGNESEYPQETNSSGETDTSSKDTSEFTSESTSESAEDTSSEDTLAKDELESGTISGRVMDATMSTITIEDVDGNTLCFVLNDNTKTEYQDGLLLDNYVEITYSGNIADSQSCAVSKIVEINVPEEK